MELEFKCSACSCEFSVVWVKEMNPGDPATSESILPDDIVVHCPLCQKAITELEQTGAYTKP